MGEIMRHMDAEHLAKAPWRMTVADEKGQIVFRLEVTVSSLL